MSMLQKCSTLCAAGTHAVDSNVQACADADILGFVVCLQVTLLSSEEASWCASMPTSSTSLHQQTSMRLSLMTMYWSKLV